MDCYIRQLTDKDCGFTSLKMLLSFLSKNKEFLYIKNPFDKECSLWDLINIANSYNVKLQGIRIENLNSEFIIDKTPFLALMRSGENTTHLVFIKKVSKLKVTIYDPKVGIIKVSKEKFFENWTGVYLKVMNSKKMIKPEKSKSIYSKKYLCFAVFLELLASCFMFCGFYYMDETSFFSLPLLLFACYVVILIISNFNLKNASMNFDKKLGKLLYRNKSNFLTNYESSLKYKTLLFLTPSKLLSSLIIVSFSVIILCINDYLNTYFLIVLFFITAADGFLFYKTKMKYSINMENLETKLNQDNLSENEFENLYKKLSLLSNKYSNIILIRKYIIYFIIFCLVFILMAINAKLEFNYLIFNFFMYCFVYNNLTNFFMFKETNEERKYLKAKFVSLIN